jgi:O-acetyl-ADP-ribose deacetylase (regulator of RNase III)
MEVSINQAKLTIIQGDITLQTSDAIVNAANSSLMGGGGVDGAIHRAGGPQILEECKKIVASQGPLPAGQAVITTGGYLPAKYVIHTVGPVYRGGSQNEPSLLISAYHESLKLAEQKRLASLAFPSISTGAYGYPVKEAAQIAIKTILEFLKNEAASLQEVVMVLYDSHTLKVYQQALSALLPS